MGADLSKSLLGAARLWPTPTADSATERSSTYAQGGTPLTAAVRLWPTPRCADGMSSRLPTPAAIEAKGGPRGRLEEAVSLAEPKPWPTPKASDFRPGHASRANRPRRRNLNDQVMAPAVDIWPTPNTVDAKGGGRKVGAASRTKSQVQLCHVVRMPTPTARDWRSGSQPTQVERGRSDGPTLAEQNGGQLNPPWVEWLMGFPIGWTASSASVTQSSLLFPP